MVERPRGPSDLRFVSSPSIGSSDGRVDQMNAENTFLDLPQKSLRHLGRIRRPVGATPLHRHSTTGRDPSLRPSLWREWVKN
jgi:hypothetical protein